MATRHVANFLISIFLKQRKNKKKKLISSCTGTRVDLNIVHASTPHKKVNKIILLYIIVSTTYPYKSSAKIKNNMRTTKMHYNFILYSHYKYCFFFWSFLKLKFPQLSIGKLGIIQKEQRISRKRPPFWNFFYSFPNYAKNYI